MKLVWNLRHQPLEPCGIFIQKPWESLDFEIKKDWEIFKGTTQTIIIGPQSALPWVEDSNYLGHSPKWSTILLPTIWEPVAPNQDLFIRALFNQCPDGVALLKPNRVVKLNKASLK